MIAPVVAAALMRPLDPSGADVFDLGAVVDEGVVVDCVAFRPAGKVDTDVALREEIL